MTKLWRRVFSLYMLLPAALMLYWVFVPFAANLFSSNTALLDNRPLNHKPEKLSLDFAREFEAYYNDTFAGRKKFLKKLAKFKMKWELDNGTTINGRDGWSFYDSGKVPDGYTLVDYFGKVRFTEAEMKRMAEGITKARDYYEKRGIKYYLIIAPNKEGLYSEYMPSHLQGDRVSDKSRMDLAVEYLQKHTDVNIINFRDVLTASKHEYGVNLYYPGDSHWNEVGAYVAFEKLSETLSRDGVRGIPRKPLRKEMIGLKGFYSSDLNRLGGDEDISYSVDFLSGKEGNAVVSLDNRFFEVWENPKAPVKKTVLMIRDSFGLALMPYLDKTFAKNVFAHNRYNKRHELDRLVAEYKPDIMIEEMVERYFDRLLKYNELYGE